jgi:hypothetical protein
MFEPSRDEARRFFFEAWGKDRQRAPLTPLEAIAVDIIRLHPEYHALLDDPERHLDRDFGPESGRMNPFLHLSLHLAIEEQLSIDQPRGIRERFQRLAEKCGDAHEAKHAVLECLGETIWQAQRSGTPPDDKTYLGCIDRKTGTQQTP